MRQILSTIATAGALTAFSCAVQLQEAATAQPTGGMQKATQEQEATFIPLEVSPPFTFQQGTVFRTNLDGRRFIQFIGTTAMPPYFEYVKNTQTYERAAWQKQLLLSKGRWVFKYKVDCDSLTFDREADQVGWRDVYLDPTSYAAFNLFCPQDNWEKLPLIQSPQI